MPTKPEPIAARLADIALGAAASGEATGASDAARAHALDTLGLIAAGHDSASVRRALDFVGTCRAGAPGPAGLAFLWGAGADALSLDDFDEVTRLHPGAVVLPPVLALAGRGTTAACLERGLAAGYEVMLRLGEVIGSHRLHGRGVHPTSILGPLAGAAAVAVSQGSGRDETARAIGLAASLASGIFELDPGNTVKGMQVGHAAANAVRAWRMVQAGYRPAADALEGERGWLRAVTGESVTGDELDDDPGTDRVARTSFKPYAHFTDINPASTGLIRAIVEGGIAPDDVREVRFHLRQPVGGKLTASYPPRNRKEALRSPHWVAACVLGAGHVPAMHDPLVADLDFSPERAAALDPFARRCSWIADLPPDGGPDGITRIVRGDGSAAAVEVNGYPGDGRQEGTRWGYAEIASRLDALGEAAANVRNAYDRFAAGGAPIADLVGALGLGGVRPPA